MPLSFVSSFLKAFLSFVKNKNSPLSCFFLHLKKKKQLCIECLIIAAIIPGRGLSLQIWCFSSIHDNHMRQLNRCQKRCFMLRGAQMCFLMIHFVLKSLVVALSRAVRGKNDVNSQYNAFFYNGLRRTFESIYNQRASGCIC